MGCSQGSFFLGRALFYQRLPSPLAVLGASPAGAGGAVRAGAGMPVAGSGPAPGGLCLAPASSSEPAGPSSGSLPPVGALRHPASRIPHAARL